MLSIFPPLMMMNMVEKFMSKDHQDNFNFCEDNILKLDKNLSPEEMQ